MMPNSRSCYKIFQALYVTAFGSDVNHLEFVKKYLKTDINVISFTNKLWATFDELDELSEGCKERTTACMTMASAW